MFKKKCPKESYDSQTQKPIIRASICTGEQVAGFKDRNTGKFTEVMLIRKPDDIRKFAERYGISQGDISKEY